MQKPLKYTNFLFRFSVICNVFVYYFVTLNYMYNEHEQKCYKSQTLVMSILIHLFTNLCDYNKCVFMILINFNGLIILKLFYFILK